MKWWYVSRLRKFHLKFQKFIRVPPYDFEKLMSTFLQYQDIGCLIMDQSNLLKNFLPQPFSTLWGVYPLVEICLIALRFSLNLCFKNDFINTDLSPVLKSLLDDVLTVENCQFKIYPIQLQMAILWILVKLLGNYNGNFVTLSHLQIGGQILNLI